MKDSIPFFRPLWSSEPLHSQVLERLADITSSGRYVLGDWVAAFERAFAERLGDESVIAVNSGTDALLLAMHLLELGEGDEVILPSYTFFGCYEAVVRARAIPVLCDSGEDSFLPGTEQIQQAFTPRTRAVMCVSLFGDTRELEPISQFCRDRDLLLIEDTAQACGGWSLNDRNTRQPAGGWGDASIFSFYPSKVLGAMGDAGAIRVADAERADRAVRLRNHGLLNGKHLETGLNSRMDEIQAAVLCLGLENLDDWLRQRRVLAEFYLRRLQGIPNMELPSNHDGHAWNYFVVRHPRRDQLASALKQQGIGTQVYYRQPLHRSPGCRATQSPGVSLPNCERHSDRALALPLFPGLTLEEAERICVAIENF